jgi:hypothetical protein
VSFPYIFHSNFELGTNAEWDSETDTVSQLDIAHYVELARFPWGGCTPHSGAYAMRLALTGGTADAFLTSATIAMANAVTSYFRFPIYFSPTFTATADDTFAILELQGAASAVTVSFGGKITAATGDIQLGIGAAASAAVPATFMTAPIERGKWYTVELKVVIQTGGTGTVDMYVTRDGDPQQVTAQASLTGKTNIAVTAGVLGIQDQLATTTGMILVGQFVQDDLQLYVLPRYKNRVTITKSRAVFVGPGSIADAALLTTTASDTLRLWDTDSADTTLDNGAAVELVAGAQTNFTGPLHFEKGCFAQLVGSTARGQVGLVTNNLTPGELGPLAYSDPGVRRYAQRG